MTDLDALLARAVELEVKAAEVAERIELGRELTPDAREDLTVQATEKYDGEVHADVIAELEQRLEALQDQLDAVEDFDGTLPGVDPVADWEAGGIDDDVAGMDFTEPDDPVTHKALGCSHCGSHDVDELAGGGRQCGDCGWGIKSAPHDFDED